jgi:hypothetical protein
MKRPQAPIGLVLVHEVVEAINDLLDGGSPAHHFERRAALKGLVHEPLLCRSLDNLLIPSLICSESKSLVALTHFEADQ